MFKKHDLNILGEAHDANRAASEMLAKVEACKTDLKARHLRIEARALMTASRAKMRALKKYLIEKDCKKNAN